MAGRIRDTSDHDERRCQKLLLERVMDGVGLQRTERGRAVVIIDGSLDPVFVNEVLGLWLKEILCCDIDTDMHDRQPVGVAFTDFVPVPNVWSRQTGGVLARASGRVKKLEEDDRARKVAQPY